MAKEVAKPVSLEDALRALAAKLTGKELKEIPSGLEAIIAYAEANYTAGSAPDTEAISATVSTKLQADDTFITGVSTKLQAEEPFITGVSGKLQENTAFIEAVAAKVKAQE